MTDAIHIKEIERITDGKLFGNGDGSVRYLATDSRSLPGIDEVIFIAIRGEHHDGNKYIAEVYNRGVRFFLTDNQPDCKDFPEAGFVLVDDSLKALQRLAGERRKLFRGTVISITGSNGKTIVKEWLYQILHEHARVVRSPRSYNSQLGVPLSLWQLSNSFDYAIIEAGISRPGEMQILEKIIAPDIGILTNIGHAHAENFKSDEEKLKEKLQLFRNSRMLVYRKDLDIHEKPVDVFLKNTNAKKAGWSLKQESGWRFSVKGTSSGAAFLLLSKENTRYEFRLPFTDDASIENLCHVITLLLEIGLTPEQISKGLEKIEPVRMRLETLKGIFNSTIVNDGYNSDLTGLGVALDVLDQQRKHSERAVILSDFYQSGMVPEQLYGEVAALLRFRNINKIYCIGEEISGCRHLFNEGTKFYEDVGQFLTQFDKREIRDTAVLIKGARKFRFEEITSQLQLQYHKTVLEINMDALIHNLNYFRSLLRPGTKIMVMVKALAYGIGAYEIAGYLQHEKVDYLAVAFPDEGIRLRNSGVQLPVMVMNTDFRDYRQIVENRLEPEIFSREGLQEFIRECRYLGISDHPVHIKLDTGMHRLGFEEKDLDWLCEHLQAPEIRVRSIFTHLAGSDDEGLDHFTRAQAGKMKVMAEKIMEVAGRDVLLHTLNSAGIERFPELQFDMVRLGIGLYGIGESKVLQPVSTFKTVISQLRDVEAGETVGYGRSGKVKRRSTVATIPVGYADGVNRRLGNGRYAFLVGGKKAPTIGNICMDMTMLDVTGLGANVGDEVEIFGSNMPVANMAKTLDTIVYEILAGIPERVKRVYIKE
ncbi:MAG: bifunctional UDP-N-acetylmuramoyl-tripeptide:D-alanyl-D-alanine ligase/alanine racemase [Bacteroidales bacterium]|nr:bifunctional UDP-N-acetylmuramoyl-tripeptide:D-alanyl-D-alanine ligase/alanine racemase [Bacteroidales bacterium]